MTLTINLIAFRFVLGPLDEIILILEDNSMNLQSMSASPFIGPFMSTVQKWEKCLTLVSEIIEEWLATQRKWLYLEGIFIGGDIRDQLPDEAQKFDDIDKAFIRVKESIFLVLLEAQHKFILSQLRSCTRHPQHF